MKSAKLVLSCSWLSPLTLRPSTWRHLSWSWTALKVHCRTWTVKTCTWSGFLLSVLPVCSKTVQENWPGLVKHRPRMVVLIPQYSPVYIFTRFVEARNVYCIAPPGSSITMRRSSLAFSVFLNACFHSSGNKCYLLLLISQEASGEVEEPWNVLSTLQCIADVVHDADGRGGFRTTILYFLHIFLRFSSWLSSEKAWWDKLLINSE